MLPPVSISSNSDGFDLTHHARQLWDLVYSLYAEQAQYHAVHGVDTRRHSERQITVFVPVLSFQHGHLSARPPCSELGIGRNGADFVPSYRGGLSAHSNETISGTWSRSPDARTVRNVVTALRTSATVDSADACWRPRGQKNTGTPNMVEDTRNGGLAPPAVPSAQIRSIRPDSNRGTARWDCKPETPKRGAVGIPPAFRRRRMSTGGSL